jgi:hypothetical protein
LKADVTVEMKVVMTAEMMASMKVDETVGL